MNRQALGLYIHIPFCKRKCHYCDFYSVAADPERIRRYADAVIFDMEKQAEKYRDCCIDSLFVGGGTPSVAGEHLIRILEKARECFTYTDDAEMTCEANPESLTLDLMLQLKQAGINRISMGAQSFCDDELMDLGRLHDRSRVVEACYQLRQAGFENINVDIMFGVGHRLCLKDHRQAFAETLNGILDLDIPHISCYNLTVQENTPLCHTMHEYRFPSEEEEEQMYDLLCSRLAQEGYEHYEISNFAKAGFACRHNYKYWKSYPYLGFGPSAHSFVGGVRFYCPSDLDKYLTGETELISEEILTPSSLAYERLVMGLRTKEGVQDAELAGYFDLSRLKQQLQPLLQQNMVVMTHDGFSLTERGYRVSNAIIRQLSTFYLGDR